LLAQKLRPMDAACLGVWLHANAGDRVMQAQGAIGMLASDLMPEIRIVLNNL
jgi:NAD(P)H-hydrate epimerase